MTTQPNPQLGSAIALQQLLTEFPELPTASWSISSISGDLHGHLHIESFRALNEYVRVLGGSVRASENTLMRSGHEVRIHWLESTWRDVRVTVAIALPTPASVPPADEGQAAEQQHLLIDLDRVAVHRPVRLGAAA